MLTVSRAVLVGTQVPAKHMMECSRTDLLLLGLDAAPHRLDGLRLRPHLQWAVCKNDLCVSSTTGREVHSHG